MITFRRNEQRQDIFVPDLYLGYTKPLSDNVKYFWDAESNRRNLTLKLYQCCYSAVLLIALSDYNPQVFFGF